MIILNKIKEILHATEKENLDQNSDVDLDKGLMEQQNQKNELLDQYLDIINDLSKQIIDISSKAGSGNETINKEISVVISNTKEDNGHLEEAFGNIMSMSANIQQISQSATEVTGSTEKATNLTDEGNSIVQELSNQMTVINNISMEMTEIINDLKEKTDKIQVITDTIKSISAQTNLLALNAAIESARAGEHGRGFSVVADEVRKLSEQSSKASGEIAELIKNIKNQTDGVFNKMKLQAQEVEKGSGVTNKTSSIFENIFGSVSTINIGMQQISASTQENYANSQTVVSSLVDVIEHSKHNHEGALNIFESSEGQTRKIMEMLNLCQQISDLTREMKNI